MESMIDKQSSQLRVQGSALGPLVGSRGKVPAWDQGLELAEAPEYDLF